MTVSVTTPGQTLNAHQLRVQKQKRGPGGKFLPKWMAESEVFAEFVRLRGNPRTSGLLAHQINLFRSVMQNEKSLILMPRGHGKTWWVCFFIEYIMEVHGESVLYLSWTDIKNQVSLWVFQYFASRNLLSEQKGSINTFKHFTLSNGAQFHTYSTTGREMLGFHNYVIIADDPIDMSFKERPQKESMVELIWSSTVANITAHEVSIVPKMIIIGTRKFKGDFYDFATEMYQEDLNIIKSTPWNEDGTLLCPELWTEEMLEKRKREIGVYMFSAEFMQDPKPVEGGDWDDVQYISQHGGKFAYDKAIISVDRATTQNAKSDYTGFVIILRERSSTRECVVLEDLTGKYDFETTKNKIQETYDYLRQTLLDCSVMVVLEQQAGGSDLYSSAKTQDYTWTNNCKLTHSTRNKEDKIRDALGTADVIDGKKYLKRIKFIRGSEQSQVVEQIRTFPGCLAFNDDAIDALAMGLMQMQLINNDFSKWVFSTPR